MLVKVKCLRNRNTEELDYIEGQEYYACMEIYILAKIILK